MEFFDVMQSIATPLGSILRSVFFFIDSIIYVFIPIIYDFAKTLIDIQGLIGNEEAVLNSVANNIYGLLAIIMFFRLGFALLYMLADPDKFEDKEKGFSKLIVNVMGCLALIIMVPYIFGFATRIQKTIIEDNVIEGIFLGDISYCSDYDYSLENNSASCITPNLGLFVSRAVLTMFIFPTNGVDINENDEAISAYNRFAKEIEDDNAWFSILSFQPHLNKLDTGALGFGTYKFTYMPIISGAVGFYMIWIFITFALDIAYRSLKLFMLKLISPIAIVSYIDPDSAKKGIFKKWVEEVVKTYLSLFIRIAALALTSLVLLSINWGSVGNIFAKLFLILGALTLMKTMPKMFEKIFGYSGKSKEESFGKSMLAGALGGLGASTVGGVSGGLSAKAHGLDFSQGLKTGAWSGLKSGAQAGYKGGIGNMGKAMFAGNEAVGKTFGWKTGAEKRREQLKYDSEKKSGNNIFEKVQEQFSKTNKSDISDNVGEFMGSLNKDTGDSFILSNMEKGTGAMIAKTTAKNKAILSSGIFRNSDYAKAYADSSNASLKQKVFQKELERARFVASTSGATAADKNKYLKLKTYEGKIASEAAGAKKVLEEMNKNPQYSNDVLTANRLSIAENSPNNDYKNSALVDYIKEMPEDKIDFYEDPIIQNEKPSSSIIDLDISPEHFEEVKKDRKDLE